MSQPPQEPPQTPPSPAPYPAPGYTPDYAPGYSPQYGFWPYYLTPPDALLGPARRASLMLFLLAALFLLAGGCLGAGVLKATDEMVNQILDDMRQVNPQQAAMITPALLRTTYGIFAGVIVLAGLVATILGFVVRGGSMASAIVSLVLSFLPALVLLVMTLGCLVTALGNPAALAGVIVLLVPLVLNGMTIALLISAIRAAPQVDTARRQMYAMHQHQQMQYQAYAQQPPEPPQS